MENNTLKIPKYTSIIWFEKTTLTDFSFDQIFWKDDSLVKAIELDDGIFILYIDCKPLCIANIRLIKTDNKSRINISKSGCAKYITIHNKIIEIKEAGENREKIINIINKISECTEHNTYILFKDTLSELLKEVI